MIAAIAQQIVYVITKLIISDIVGDPMEFIASGPTYPDSTTFEDAKEVIKKYEMWKKLPETVKNIITDGIQAKIPERLCNGYFTR